MRELWTAGFLWIGSGMEEIDQRQKNVCPPGEPGQSGQDEHILVAHGDLREQFRLPSNQRAAVRVSIAQSNILQRGNILPNPLRPRHRCRPPLAIEIIGAGAAATSEILADLPKVSGTPFYMRRSRETARKQKLRRNRPVAGKTGPKTPQALHKRRAGVPFRCNEIGRLPDGSSSYRGPADDGDRA